MDVLYHLREQSFVWDQSKAETNYLKHGVRFESACEVFFDPLLTFTTAGTEEENREAVLGETVDRTLLFVVSVERLPAFVRIISARKASKQEKSRYENHE